MDVLKISNTKIKIMLSPIDTKKFGLDIDDVDYNDAKTRAKVWKILDSLKKSNTFDPEGEKLLIQFYPSKDGGAELFVTKLTGLSKNSERSMSKNGNVTMLDSKKTMYNFKNFNELLQASKIINGAKSIKDSELFYSDSEGYYLEITERGASRLGIICEFAVPLPYKII